jgi:hypothetical protein
MQLLKGRSSKMLQKEYIENQQDNDKETFKIQE